MNRIPNSDLDESYFEDSSFEMISNPEDYEKSLISRKRAKEVLDELTLGLPDPDFENEIRSQALLDLHIERLNRLVKENLDASSIWEFVFLAGDMRQSLAAQRSVRNKLAADPKQAAKINVRECWDLWQNEPSRYKGKAAFARDMLDKHESLENQRVIERWCKEWESVLF